MAIMTKALRHSRRTTLGIFLGIHTFCFLSFFFSCSYQFVFPEQSKKRQRSPVKEEKRMLRSEQALFCWRRLEKRLTQRAAFTVEHSFEETVRRNQVCLKKKTAFRWFQLEFYCSSSTGPAFLNAQLLLGPMPQKNYSDKKKTAHRRSARNESKSRVVKSKQ